MRLLMNDVSRCHGDENSLLCASCARRVQMILDDRNGWYSYIMQQPVDDKCNSHIPVKDGVLREQAEQHMHNLRVAGM
jgi:hypothetical protein